MADRVTQITEAARGLLATEGPDALSMRRIADRVGIRAPSLYKHFPDKAAVEAALQTQAMAEMAEVLEAAVGRDATGAARDGGEPALLELATAYRGYALANPHLYRITAGRALARHALPEGLEARAARPLITAVGGDHDNGRAFWGFLHGMVMLELDGRFPPGADLEPAWRSGCQAFATHTTSTVNGSSTDSNGAHQ